MDLQETQISSEALYQGSFLDIYRDEVRLPNGKHSGRIVVKHTGATCVLAIAPCHRVILVRQWRYPVGQALLEVPAGKLEKGEDPALCALRELAEETPFEAKQVVFLTKFYTAPGFCDEIMHLYRAVEVSETSQLSADEDEFTETVLLSRDEVRQAIECGEICDAKTLIALNFWLNEQD